MSGFFGDLIRDVDVAIDLGTAKTAVYVRGEGVVFQQPTLVTLKAGQSRRQSLIAIGDRADEILGKEPKGVRTVRPLECGVIQNLDVARMMLEEIAERIDLRTSLRRLNVLIGAPRRITDVERRAVREAALSLGTRRVAVVDEPLAAAVGAAVDIESADANMVVDIGSGITEVVILAGGGVISSESVRVGGDAISDALLRYLRRDEDLIVGLRTVEALKEQLSLIDDFESAGGYGAPTLAVKGLDVHSRLPRQRLVSPVAARRAIAEPVAMIVQVVRRAFETASPAVSADLSARGIVLTGGTALLHGLDQAIADATGVEVRVTPDPLGAMVRGAGLMLDHMRTIRHVQGLAQ